MGKLIFPIFYCIITIEVVMLVILSAESNYRLFILCDGLASLSLCFTRSQ